MLDEKDVAYHKEEIIENLKYELFIFYDTMPTNPLEHDSWIPEMITRTHNRYTLGHERFDINEIDREDGWDDYAYQYFYDRFQDEFEENDNYKKMKPKVKEFVKNSICYRKITLLDHSGITIKPVYHCPWDSSFLGIVFVSYDEMKKERIPVTEDNANKLINDFIDTYDAYLTGDVYGYSFRVNGVEEDSCWGYYGTEGFNRIKEEFSYFITNYQRKHKERQNVSHQFAQI